jgi:hypothetical protein
MQARARESSETSIPPLNERWEHFPHEADMGVRGYGGTLGEAFAAAATAMTAIVTEPSQIEPGSASGLPVPVRTPSCSSTTS